MCRTYLKCKLTGESHIYCNHKKCGNGRGMSQYHWQQAALIHFIVQPAAAGSRHP